MIDVYLGLGSNLSDPQAQITDALSAIEQLGDTEIVRCSGFYASKPMGPQQQPDYVNAVVQIKTCLLPMELLRATQTIELQQGRERKDERWGPRTLDIDLLLYGQEQINIAHLQIPHYGMKEREFVLYPLYEINPQLTLPSGETLQALVNTCPKNGLFLLSVAPLRWQNT